MKIEDLKFSDIEQQAIAKNGIKKTYLVSASNIKPYRKHDTIGVVKYNENGNILGKTIKGVFGTRIEYKYDSLNIEVGKKYSTDFATEFNFDYEFIPDSLILYKRYKNPIHKNINGNNPRISGKFKFNKLGFLIEKSAYQNNDLGAGGRWTTQYKYDSLNKLKSEKTYVNLSKVIDTATKWHMPFSRKTMYFYTGKKIDSARTTYFYLNDQGLKGNYHKITLYNKDGLVKKTILSDTIITFYHHEK